MLRTSQKGRSASTPGPCRRLRRSRCGCCFPRVPVRLSGPRVVHVPVPRVVEDPASSATFHVGSPSASDPLLELSAFPRPSGAQPAWHISSHPVTPQPAGLWCEHFPSWVGVAVGTGISPFRGRVCCDRACAGWCPHRVSLKGGLSWFWGTRPSGAPGGKSPCLAVSGGHSGVQSL